MEPITMGALYVLGRAVYALGTSLSRTSAAQKAGPQIEAAGKAVLTNARDLSEIIRTEIAAGRVRGRAKKDLEYLERELRTGGVTESEYVRRVRLTLEGASSDIARLQSVEAVMMVEPVEREAKSSERTTLPQSAPQRAQAVARMSPADKDVTFLTCPECGLSYNETMAACPLCALGGV